MEKEVSVPVGWKLDADKALLALGTTGRYQLWVFSVSSFIWFFICLQLMASAFLSAAPPFHCHRPDSPRILSNLTYDSQCSLSSNDSDLSCGVDASVDYDSNFGNTIVSEWDLVCTRSYMADLSSSVFFLGYLIGSLLAPMASDRWGRRKPLLLSILGLASVGTLLATSPSYWVFCALRIAAGIFVAGTGVTAFVSACEVMEPSKRSWGAWGSGTAWSIGYCLVAPIAWALPDWRYMALGLSLPSWLALSYYWFVPESLHWLIAKGRLKEAGDWIANASKWNKVHVEWQECLSRQVSVIRLQRPFWHLCTSPVLVAHTLVLAYMWFANSFIYYGLSLFTITLAGNRYVNFVLSGLVEIPPHFLVTYLFNCIGRKKTLALFHFAAAVTLGILPFVSDSEDMALVRTSVWLGGKFCVAVTFPGIWMYASEIFPTTVRTSGVGLCSMSARVGGILAPFVGTLADVSKALPPMIFGCMSFLASCLVLILPETNKRMLPDDIDEIDPGPVLKIVCNK